MNLNDFKALPIGTVLKWQANTWFTFEVKISKNCSLIVFDDFYGYVGEVDNYLDDEWALEDLSIAPKWIADKFEVLQ